MSEQSIYNLLLVGWCILALSVFVTLFSVTVPYGRHLRRGWGLGVASQLGWMIMEAPSVVLFAFLFVLGRPGDPVALAFLGLWEVHYVHRAFVYPLVVHESAKRMPLLIVGMGAAFNVLNSYLNGRYLFAFAGDYGMGWLGSARFLVGLLLFVSGFAINRQADRILRRLRRRGDSGYSIPHGALYRWVSCPNYLGEIIEWTGWAIATWSWPGLAFALWTIANLAPRARAHHRWYHAHFPDYPADRKALIPAIW